MRFIEKCAESPLKWSSHLVERVWVTTCIKLGITFKCCSVVVKMLLKSKPVRQILSVFILTLSVVSEAKRYDRCDLARELKTLHRFPADQIATWICIAKYESNYNTDAWNKDSGDHGLFQISQLFWCSPPGEGRACNRACKDFRDDDIADDVSCVKRIYREHQRLSGDGFNAWVAYQHYCRGDVSHYTEGCFSEKHGNGSSTTVRPQVEKKVKGQEKGAVDTLLNIYNFIRATTTTTTPRPGVFSGLFGAVVSNLNPFASKGQDTKRNQVHSTSKLGTVGTTTDSAPTTSTTAKKLSRKYTINNYEISRSSGGFSIIKTN